jgi:hypothetical protein
LKIVDVGLEKFAHLAGTMVSSNFSFHRAGGLFRYLLNPRFVVGIPLGDAKIKKISSLDSISVASLRIEKINWRSH